MVTHGRRSAGLKSRASPVKAKSDSSDVDVLDTHPIMMNDTSEAVQ